MLVFITIIICVILHFALALHQEARHKRDIKNLSKILTLALRKKVKAMTRSRQRTRQRHARCHCLGEWEIRQLRATLVEDIMIPFNNYLEDEMN